MDCDKSALLKKPSDIQAVQKIEYLREKQELLWVRRCPAI
jgi:hypothetical protein